MADANLIYAIKSQGKNGFLKDIVVFGKVRCAIKRPSVIGTSVEAGNGFFAIIDAFALKCLDTDYFAQSNCSDINKVYLTKGSMIIFINSRDWIGKFVKVYGKTTRQGVNIRQQWGKKSESDGITAFVFNYSNGKYVVAPNKLSEIGQKDSDITGTVLSDVLVSLVGSKDGIIEYPVSLDTIIPYTGTEEYDEIPVEDMEASEVKFIDSSGRVDISNIKMNLEHHLTGAKISQEDYKIVKDDIRGMEMSRSKYVNKIRDFVREGYTAENDDDFVYSDYGYTGTDDPTPTVMLPKLIVDLFASNIVSRYHENIGNSKTKGKFFVEEFKSLLSESPWNSSDNSDNKISPEILSNAIDIFGNTVQVDPTVIYGNTGTEIDSIKLLSSPIEKCIAVISCVSGIPFSDLKANFMVCEKSCSMSIHSWFWTLVHIPYLLGLLAPGLSLEYCDILYFCFSRILCPGMFIEDNEDVRRKYAFLDTIKELGDNETFINRRLLYRKRISYDSKRFKYLSSFGVPAQGGYAEAIRVMMGNDVVIPKDKRLGLVEYRWYTKALENELMDLGLINDVNGYIVLQKDIEKEFKIYDILVHKGNQETGITDEQVESTIAEFEESRGFKLEPLQRDGIMLCKYKAGVLSGCAGSGKTTTSDCMAELLKQLEGYKIIYCTPTGKACRRLAEVVRSTVKTIHSQFGLGLYGESHLSREFFRRKSPDEEAKKFIYICDEMAMCSTRLIYSIANSMGKDDMAFFMGDVRQLPPIGKGAPFQMLMKLLPCVELGVSKRAAEGSLINYNTTLINHMSDGVVHELVYDDFIFMKKDCPDVNIPSVICNEWVMLMKRGIEEDDIQAITGYQKQEISFSAPRLNKPLQVMLRSDDKLLFRHVDREFYQNDRIIHLRRNDYTMCRYIEESPNCFKELVTVGVVNGEVGKLVGTVRSDFVSFEPYVADACTLDDPIYSSLTEDELKNLKENRASREDALRVDEKLRSSKNYFIKFEVYDVDLCRNVYVLYRARAVNRNGIEYFEGSDLSNIDLAYALTTHKMQGSQSRAVLLAFGSACNPVFMNRNMINTMITRSQEIVSCVGSVSGIDSALNQGRLEKSRVNSNDLLSFFAEE